MIGRREFIALVGSAAAARPLAAWAQQPQVPVVGFLSSLSREGAVQLEAAFQQGLNEAGYVYGQNVAIEYMWALGQYERLPTIATEFVRRPLSVLVTVGGEPAALAAKAATSTIPIVFLVGSDPVKLGLVASYNRPGGNATGINMLTETIEPKRIGILRELLPQASKIAVLTNPNFPPAEMQSKEIDQAARTLGMQTEQFRASTESEIEAAFQSIAQQHLPAMIVATDPFFVARRSDLIALAARHRLPALYGFRDLVMAGGLMSYGIDLREVYRQLGHYTARILKGAQPADLPVQQPTKFEFVINLKTAKTLGLIVPDKLLALADEVIE
jgi:putative tryptophan/tyrosine transport system substrate-binding protein